MAGRGPPPPPALQHMPQLTAPDMPLSLSSLIHVLRDCDHLTNRYGSTSAACARLDELEHMTADMQAQIAALQQKLGMAMAAAKQAEPPASARAPLDVDSLLGFLQRQCACRGNLALLRLVLQDYQRWMQLPPDARLPQRDVLLSIDEIVPVAPPNDAGPPQRQPFHQGNGFPTRDVRPARTPEPPRYQHPPPQRQPTVSSPMRHAPHREQNAAAPSRPIAPPAHATAASAAITLSSLSRPTSSSPSTTAARPQVSNPSSSAPARTTPTNGSSTVTVTEKPRSKEGLALRYRSLIPSSPPPRKRYQDPPPSAPDQNVESPPPLKRTRTTTTTTTTASPPPSTENKQDKEEEQEEEEEIADETPVVATHTEVVVKQNLSLPHDKRNIVELKQSSQLLTLATLEALNRRAPWDDFYQRRATFSHILDYHALDDRARKWFIGALRVQFVWRREFWERLHWLPMSEAVCHGQAWERYRQTRKRRANKAIAAWRKVYSDSLELMRDRLLPEDVWCDVSLWYMPSTPLYWLPGSADLDAELDAVDAKHPVRCYHLKDLAKHPFYRDDDTQKKYPHRHPLPPPQLIALTSDDKESRVNITPE